MCSEVRGRWVVMGGDGWWLLSALFVLYPGTLLSICVDRIEIFSFHVYLPSCRDCCNVELTSRLSERLDSAGRDDLPSTVLPSSIDTAPTSATWLPSSSTSDAAPRAHSPKLTPSPRHQNSFAKGEQTFR